MRDPETVDDLLYLYTHVAPNMGQAISRLVGKAGMPMRFYGWLRIFGMVNF